jgi:hypothetical protein
MIDIMGNGKDNALRCLPKLLEDLERGGGDVERRTGGPLLKGLRIDKANVISGQEPRGDGS